MKTLLLLIVFAVASHAAGCKWDIRKSHIYDPTHILQKADKENLDQKIRKSTTPTYVAFFENPSDTSLEPFEDVVKQKAKECGIAVIDGSPSILLGLRVPRRGQNPKYYWDVEAGGKKLYDEMSKPTAMREPFHAFTDTRQRLSRAFGVRVIANMPPKQRSNTMTESALATVRELWKLAVQ